MKNLFEGLECKKRTRSAEKVHQLLHTIAHAWPHFLSCTVIQPEDVHNAIHQPDMLRAKTKE
ncbi:MAG: hypothetical protein I8H87_09890 [Comamonadaceae bacterium]|jgi:hypothetical protein|nr:hypothetical protein [Comamonadaceae bacterium]